MAAGRGSRFGADAPKQYLSLLGRPVLRHAAEALLRDGLVDSLLPVCAAGEEAHVAALLAEARERDSAAQALAAGASYAGDPDPYVQPRERDDDE